MSNVPRKSETASTVKYTHQSAFNEIVGMAHVGLSHYFVAHWLPKISPNGLKILIQLRSMGYFDPKTETKRGDIDIEQSELAELIGISKKTIQRAFAEDEVLAKYVQRVFQVKRDKFGRIVKEHYVYVVVMDDVLIPQDKARYEILLQGPEKSQIEVSELPKRHNDASDNKPKRHNGTSAIQSDAPKRHFGPNKGQTVASYNEILTPLTEDLSSPTPAVRPKGSLALFPEEAPDNSPDGSKTPKRWDDLTEAERAPFIATAERELKAIYPERATNLNRRMVEVRAKNLFEHKGKPS